MMCFAILEDFGEASGLRINPLKCVALPIRCADEQVELVTSVLGCPLGSFPCRYLGLSLSNRKQTVGQFQDIVEGLLKNYQHGRRFLWKI